MVLLQKKCLFFFIKLADKSSNVLLQGILGTYGHLMWVRTEVPKEMIVKVVTTPELTSETRGGAGSAQKGNRV